jgi:hypothetical protein
LRDHDTQTSGASRRENADAYPLFEIRIGMQPRHCLRQTQALAQGGLATKQSILPTGTAATWIASLALAMTAVGQQRQIAKLLATALEPC